MTCIQNIIIPTTRLGTLPTRVNKACPLSRLSFLQVSSLRTSPTLKFQHHKIPVLVYNSPKNRICAPTCLFGGKGNSRGENKAFSWDSLKDVVKGLTDKNVAQDILRKQMRQREFGGDDGDGNPPRTRGGGGGSDGTEDEGFASIFDETLQVVMATIGFIFVYLYIIRGAELAKIVRDYIKYLLGGVPSMRLQRVMDKWRKRLSMLSYTEESEDWLERLIVTTPTWWYRPEEVVRAMKSKKRRYVEQN